MKILITGANGQLGFELRRALSVLGELIAADRTTCDLADAPAVRELIRAERPHVIVNAAAYTSVDKAESDVQAATLINTHAPGIFGEEAHRIGALVVHYSTDYVFDGLKEGAYSEHDPPDPQNVYGLTKWRGEQALAAATSQHLIFRTSWVAGVRGNNFAKTILRLAGERESLSVVADQWGAPTSAALLADATAHVLRAYSTTVRGEERFPFGTYHLTAGGETNWFEYARFVLTEALQAGKVLKTGPGQVRAVTAADYPTPAKRPANSRLSTQKFKTAFNLRLPPWQEGMKHVLAQLF